MKLTLLLLLALPALAAAQLPGKLQQNASLRVIYTRQDSLTFLEVTNLNWCDCYVWIRYLKVDRVLVGIKPGGVFRDTLRALPFEILARNLTLCDQTSTDAMLFLDSRIRAAEEFRPGDIGFDLLTKKIKCGEIIIGPGPGTTYSWLH